MLVYVCIIDMMNKVIIALFGCLTNVVDAMKAFNDGSNEEK